MRLFFLSLIFLFTVACKTESPKVQINNNIKTVEANKNSNQNMNQPKTALPSGVTFGYEIVNRYNHDPEAFTQGLAFHNGFLYESTGQLGNSSLRKVELESGKVLQKVENRRDVFAEGMTILGDKVYQVSWQNGEGYVYNLSDLSLVKTFTYAGQGWGLTNDGKNLILSDGTHVIRFLDPETFETIRTIVVNRENSQPLMNLNELEYVKGEIWANVWHSETISLPNHIARIDAASGKLLGWINLDGISPEDIKSDSENTLNGIAYDEATDRIFVTGKRWKNLYEIRLKPKS